MAFANGVFARLYSWVADRDAGIKIRADRMDAEFDGVKDALNEITAGTVQMIGAIKGYDGTVTAPGYGFNGDTNTGFYRIAADNIGVSTGGVKVGDWATTGLTVHSEDAGATAGPLLTLYRNSATPANSDVLGSLVFAGEDSAGNTQTYGLIGATILDVTSTSEDGSVYLQTVVAGTLTTQVTYASTGVVFTPPLLPSANDGAALGASGTAWADLFLASGGVINFNAGNVTIAHAAETVTVTTADAGATAGPILDLYRDSASPAASDIIGKVIFNGRDGAGNKQEYAAIEAVITDATSTSEDAALDLYATIAGTRTRYLAAGRNAAGTATANALGLPLGQISFPAAQNASSDANTLDDYEEGTWTPSDQSGATLTFTSVTATYIKIGRLVVASVRLTFPSTASGASILIGGLPFAAANTTTFGNGVFFSTAASPNGIMTGGVVSNATNFTLTESASATSAINSDLSLATIGGTMTYIAGA